MGANEDDSVGGVGWLDGGWRRVDEMERHVSGRTLHCSKPRREWAGGEHQVPRPINQARRRRPILPDEPVHLNARGLLPLRPDDEGLNRGWLCKAW